MNADRASLIPLREMAKKTWPPDGVALYAWRVVLRPALRDLLAESALQRDALIRVGGLKADGTQGFHMVGDEKHPDECPGCWAWWGLGLGARPTQEELDALQGEYVNAAEAFDV